MPSKRDEYKGNATIQLFGEQDVDKKYVFSFGLNKAKLILENIEDIKKFVEEENGKTVKN